MIQSSFLTAAVLSLGALLAGAASAQAQGRNEASPAASPVPATAIPQTYADELVEAGRVRFAADCGFCHGRDTAGGTGGADLTRSELVADDVRGNLIGEVVRQGRVDAGMPSFATMSADDLDAIVAFIHDQKSQAESASGGRRSVEVADLQTGNTRAGRRYFEANCSRCHSATGDLAGIGSRLEGLPLLQRMLYPGSEGRGFAPSPAPPEVRVVMADGEVVTGSLRYRDEFNVALTDATGRYRSFDTRRVNVVVDDPLEAHVAQLARYSDADVHDVLAYLQTLR